MNKFEALCRSKGVSIHEGRRQLLAIAWNEARQQSLEAWLQRWHAILEMLDQQHG